MSMHNLSLEMPHLRNNWKISSSVIFAHIAVLWLMTFSLYVAVPKQNVKKLLVHTVTLSSPPKQVVVAQAKPKPAPPPAPIREPEPIAKPEPEAPPSPAPKAVEEKPAPPVPKPAAAKPKPASKPESKPTPKPIPKPQPKKKEVAKPAVKSAPKPKPKPASKPTPKVDDSAKQKASQEKIKQEKAAKEQAIAKERAAQEKAKQEQAAKQQAAKQQALLDKALSSLNSASKIEGKKATVAASAAKNASSNAPAAIGSLSAEALVAIDASEVQNCTPAERTYYDELVSRLKLSLKLPDYGEVKLQLTVNRSGKVVTVKEVKSKSSKNKDYIQKALPKLHLPPFGQNFTGETEHTFRLTLSNEL